MTATPTTSPPHDATTVDIGIRTQRRRVYIASAIGSIIEYFDFLIYATAATLVFPRVFFPESTAAVGLIASFGTLAVGYLARPLGGLFFGHLGDRMGRKSVLLWTLVTMGVATMLIGLLPSYAQIGVLAPILLVLLRLVQGFAVGGEWGGASLMAVEHADEKKRGLYGSATQLGAAGGLLLSFVAFSLITNLLEEHLYSWAWRLPFLATIVMVALGVYIRLGIEESPIQKDELEKRNSRGDSGEKERWPIVQVLKERPVRVLLGIFTYAGPFMAYSVATTMLVSYASSPEQAAAHGFEAVSKGSLLNAMMIGTVGMLFTVPFFAHLSDRIGRRPVFVTSALLTVIHVFVMFPLVTSGNFGLAVLSFFVSMTILNASAMALVPALLAELFPTKSRYTGVSLTYQVGSTLGGGLGPMIAATLIVPSGPGTVAVSVMIASLCVVAAICGSLLGDTRKVDLRDA